MKISAAGLRLIKRHEGFRTDAYPDAGYGWSRATIGYGHTSAAGPPTVTKGMTITKGQAEQILRTDLDNFSKDMMKYVSVPLTQGQFDALVSFVFNVGIGNFKDSTLRRKLNQGDYEGAAAEFPKWRKSNGKVFTGLVHRRAQEKALFTTEMSSLPEEYTNTEVERDTGTPMPQSTTVWTEILTTLTGSIGALFGLGREQPWLAAFVIAVLVLGAVYIIRERKRHGVEGMV